MPKKNKKKKKFLELYESKGNQYFNGNCKRKKRFDLGRRVFKGTEECIVCGFNSDCTYDIFSWETKTVQTVTKDEISNKPFDS